MRGFLREANGRVRKGVVRTADKQRSLRRIAAMAILVAGALALGACTSTGSSSFGSQPVLKSAQTEAIADERTGSVVPLAENEAPEPAPGQAYGDPILQANSQQANPPRIDPDQTEIAAVDDSHANPPAGQALQQAYLPQPQNQPVSKDRTIALASLAAGDAAAVLASQASLAYASEPAEEAAEQRINALYGRIQHGECKSGWGPRPMTVNAKRIDPGHPYYMEMRLRHTPPLPIGHVYIAYGRIDAAGEPVDEKLVMLSPIGGYAGAAVASAIPMPGLLTPHPDDCLIKPIAAYRVSLSASQYEQLLLEIGRQKQKKPTYSLFAYNCNMFMSDVAKSVGIMPPKNIYNPSLVYFYEMMDRNEGRKVPRAPGADLEIAQARPIQPVN